MGVEFRLLGSVDAAVDGRAVDIGSARQRIVLVALLVDANQVVPPDQLVWRVWGNDPPPSAMGTLYSYVSRLRRALAVADDVRIARQSGGYVVIADPGAIDLYRFGELLTRTRNSGDDDNTVTQYEQALRLWRGEAFAALDSPWINRVRTGLDAERYAAELDHNELKLRLGLHNDLLAALSARTLQHPLDERLAGQLMLALFRSGRQAEALQAYRRTRALLVDELGAEPVPELQRLHQAILRGDPHIGQVNTARVGNSS
jgi:DNA-binding SARP family transcriptional activator